MSLSETFFKDNGKGKSSQQEKLGAVYLVIPFAWKEKCQI
jgi:hypothetical protein